MQNGERLCELSAHALNPGLVYTPQVSLLYVESWQIIVSNNLTCKRGMKGFLSKVNIRDTVKFS